MRDGAPPELRCARLQSTKHPMNQDAPDRRTPLDKEHAVLQSHAAIPRQRLFLKLSESRSLPGTPFAPEARFCENTIPSVVLEHEAARQLRAKCEVLERPTTGSLGNP